MADPLSELRDALERLAERSFTGIVSDQGFAPASPILAPNNPFGAVATQGEDQGFGTGYDGSETTTAGIWDLSVWDGEDLWVG